MGFFDSIKDTAKNAAEQAKAKIDTAKESYAQQQSDKKEAERAAQEQANNEKEAKTAEIISGKQSDRTGIFFINSMEDTIKFTENYMKRLVLPASSLKVSKLNMMPYTNDNVSKRDVIKKFADFSQDEKIIFTLDNNTSKEYLAVTTAHLYAKIACKDNLQNFYNIKIALDEISAITFETVEELHQILINGVTLMAMPKQTRDTDFVNLKYYFECLEKSDFEITDEEVDNLIHEKIGDEAYNEAHKHMDEGELIVYFAWGLDSLTAKDFLMCTTQRFVMIDRELLGMAENVKSFFYEDINSMAIEQENKDSLTVTLLNAAMKLCDLTIHTAGTNLKIQTLSTTEADRVIEIYNQFKKAAREEAKKPIIVQAAAPAAVDPLEQIKKLQQLKEAGIIDEEEFNSKKAELLAKI